MAMPAQYCTLPLKRLQPRRSMGTTSGLPAMSASRAIVVETSANLRSSQNWEQAVVSDDRDLLTFHRTWIEKLHEETGEDATDEGADLPQ